MSWLRLDDEMESHRKTRRLLRSSGGLAAFGLHTLGLLHSSRYLTDGHVDRDMVDETLDVARVRERDRGALLSSLESGSDRMPALWVPTSDGWDLHDYLDYNPSRAEVEARRARDAERKAAGRAAQSSRRPRDVGEESG